MGPAGTALPTRTTTCRYGHAMSNVEAPGVLGLLYRKSGSSKIGNAFLEAEKAYLEDR